MNEQMTERTVFVDIDRCTGCGACVEVCPTGAVYLVDSETARYAEINQRECRGCEVCVEACPEGAIMTGDMPAIEGELVQEEAQLVSMEPQSREVRPGQPVSKALTWLGAAVVFAVREIVPRAVVTLLDAWDRRAGRLALPSNDLRAGRSGQRSVAHLPKGGRWRNRHRRRGS
jgi:heterodisulfide reductase subunit A